MYCESICDRTGAEGHLRILFQNSTLSLRTEGNFRPRGTDQDPLLPQRPKPSGDPDSSGDDDGKGRRYRAQTPMTINKWAKPIPKLELPSRIFLQKPSQTDMGVVVYECCVGHVDLEGHRGHLLAPTLPPV